MKEQERQYSTQSEGLPKSTEHVVMDIFSKDNIIEKSNVPIRGKTEKKDSSYIPAEIKHAGRLLFEARTIHGVKASEIANGLHNEEIRRGSYIIDFEEGKVADANLTKIIKVAEKYIDPEDLRIKELKEIAERQVEEAKWLWLLEKENLSVGKAVNLIRISQGETIESFAAKHSLNTKTIYNLETERMGPKLSTLTKVLKNTDFDENYKKVTQRLLLLGEGRTPISLEDFEQSGLGDNLSYLRVQNFLTQKDFARTTKGKYQGFISEVENGEREILTSTEREALQRGLKNSGFFDELLSFFDQKARGEKPKMTEEIERKLSENFYFSNEQKMPFRSPFTTKDEELSRRLKKMGSFGAGFRAFREKLGLSQYDLNKAQGFVSNLELGRQVPKDYVIADLMRGLEISLLDKTSLTLLALAEKDRKRLQR